MLTTTIPIIMQPPAAARVRELGIGSQLQEMFEHTKEVVPGLQSIEVEAWDDPSEPGQPHLMLIAWRDDPTLNDEYSIKTAWGTWFVRSFHPDVLRWFSFWVYCRGIHDR